LSPQRELDVVVLGSALVDVIASATDDQIAALGLRKGGMTLVGEQEAERIYAAMGPAVEVSGGSAVNTAVGVCSMGGRAACVARVADDTLGRVFAHDVRAAGVGFDHRPSPPPPATGRCLVMVSPDAERTMCTYLGAASRLGPEDVDPQVVSKAAVLYAEGYLWDMEPAKRAMEEAAAVARRSGAKVALSLSDPFCVERHRRELLGLVGRQVDLLFANEEEAKLLFGTDELAGALSRLEDLVEAFAVTRGPAGSVVSSPAGPLEVPAAPAAQVVDTTGAGDLYAAGFLFGYVRALAPEHCARLGALAASEVISHLGARPRQPLAQLARRAGLVPA
jgi:sugar/nucleoside kinase (ribokinase family)